MSDTPTIDSAGLETWIGREETATDLLTPRLEASLRAVLGRSGPEPATGEVATPTIHWCLAPPLAPTAGLGDDGHPARGGFMPPVPLPRRMWAGGEVILLAPLRVGDRVTRLSRIEDVAVKTGRSGPLCFVTVRHHLSTAHGPAVEERQDIVYRAPPTAAAATEQPDPVPAATWRRTVPCDPVLLFRYSAITFNGHRIHYDQAYATGAEGYAGLVVQGALQAALLVDLAQEARGTPPRRFGFRAVSPLIAGRPFSLNGVEDGAGLRLWSADSVGRATMQATAAWE